MYFLYVLKSIERGRRYIGIAKDIDKRLFEHNSGRVRSTKAYIPWHMVHKEVYDTKMDARNREAELKRHSWKRNELFNSLGI